MVQSWSGKLLVFSNGGGAPRRIDADVSMFAVGALILAEDPGEQGSSEWVLKFAGGHEMPVTASSQVMRRDEPGYLVMIATN